MTWATRAADLISELFRHLFGGAAPVIEDFVKRFTSDMGKALLADAAKFAADVKGGKSMVQAGEELLALAAYQAAGFALDDALDAIRIHISVEKKAEALAVPPEAMPA